MLDSKISPFESTIHLLILQLTCWHVWWDASCSWHPAYFRRRTFHPCSSGSDRWSEYWTHPNRYRTCQVSALSVCRMSLMNRLRSHRWRFPRVSAWEFLLLQDLQICVLKGVGNQVFRCMLAITRQRWVHLPLAFRPLGTRLCNPLWLRAISRVSPPSEGVISSQMKFLIFSSPW